MQIEVTGTAARRRADDQYSRRSAQV